MSRQLFDIIFYLETSLSALVAITVFTKYKTREMYIKLLGWLFFIGFFINTLSHLIYYFKLGNFVNVPATIYDILSICIISYFYFLVFDRKFRAIFIAIIVIYVLFWILNFFVIQKTAITSYTKLLASTIIVLYAIVYFYHLIGHLPTAYLHKMPMFWFNSAFLIYASGTIFLFAFTDYLINVLNDDLMTYWSFHNILSIISQCMFLIGLRYDLVSKPFVKSL